MKIRLFTKLLFLLGIVMGTLLAVLINLIAKSKEDKPVILRNNVFLTKKHNYYFYGDTKEGNNVMCVVLSEKLKNVRAAKDTWTKSCDDVAFLNITRSRKIILHTKGQRNSTWSLLCNLLRDLPPQKHAWILIVYDYTFALIENLKFLVSNLNPNKNYYLGHPVKFWNTMYNKGQAGYVLSKESLRSLKQKLNFANSCASTTTYLNREDYYLGKHLAQINITPSDTRDANDLATFHPENLYRGFHQRNRTHNELSVYPHRCCSAHTITFNGIEGDKMYTWYYLLYELRIYRGEYLPNRSTLPTVTDEKIWKSFLAAHNVSTNVTAEEYYQIWEKLVDSPMSFMQRIKQLSKDDEP